METRFRGNYRQYDSNGYLNFYDVADVVEYDGKKYIATTANTNKPPLTKKSGWVLYTGDYDNFFYQDDEPSNATVGDRWVDISTGRMYTYVEDDNGFHWVEF